MKKVLPLLMSLAAFVLSGGYVNTELLYRNEFSSLADLKEWNDKPEKNFRAQADNRSGVLHFKTRNAETDWLFCRLDPAKFRGKTVQLEAMVKGDNIGHGSYGYFGAKVMLYYKAGKAERYLEPFRQYGSFDWQNVAVVCRIPADCEKLELYLGIQGAPGRFRVDSVQIYACEESDAEQAAPTEPNRAALAIPRGDHKGARYRGIMSGRDLSAAAFQTLADWNANLLRYQMSPRKNQDVSTRESYLAWIDEEIEKIATLLPLAEKHRIKLILDLHRGPGTTMTKVNSNILEKVDQELFGEIWRRIAGRFKGNKNIYGYDLLNEPINNKMRDAGNAAWQQLAEYLVKTIREIDPDTPIIIEPFAAIDDFAGLKPIPADNLIYSPHFYQPFAFTHQGIFTPERWSYPGYINGIWWDKEQLRVAMKSAIDFQRKHNVPIFVGEFSAVAWSKGGERYLADTIELCEEYGWDWAYHAFRESPCWDVELEHDAERTPWQVHPAPDTPRKQALLKGLKKNCP